MKLVLFSLNYVDVHDVHIAWAPLEIIRHRRDEGMSSVLAFDRKGAGTIALCPQSNRIPPLTFSTRIQS